MSATNSSVCVLLVVTSDTAFLDFKGIPILIRAFESLLDLFPSNKILVASSPKDAPKVLEVLESRNATFELLIPETLEAGALAMSLEGSLQHAEAVLIHDASRPLTPRAQFESVLAAFKDEIDAVRPAVAFTETLKILDANSVIKRTLDRSAVLRISTPELIRVSTIDVNGKDSGWLLPLREDARTLHVEGSPDGLRINTVEDRDLMELGTN